MKLSHRCAFQPNISREEAEGLNWLSRVLNNIREVGPSHKNYENAAACARAIDELGNFCIRVHQTGHELLETLVKLEDSQNTEDHAGFDFAQYKMTVQEKGNA